jgi:hypothetical protein
MKTPTGLSSSVAYPFAFIKPCGDRGDVTLKEINKRIYGVFDCSEREYRRGHGIVSYADGTFLNRPAILSTFFASTSIH